MIQLSMTVGYGISTGHVVPGIGAVSYRICNTIGEPVASIAIVGALDDFGANAIPSIVSALRSQVADIETASYVPIIAG